jgi:hypothetical protein
MEIAFSVISVGRRVPYRRWDGTASKSVVGEPSRVAENEFKFNKGGFPIEGFAILQVVL